MANTYTSLHYASKNQTTVIQGAPEETIPGASRETEKMHVAERRMNLARPFKAGKASGYCFAVA